MRTDKAAGRGRAGGGGGAGLLPAGGKQSEKQHRMRVCTECGNYSSARGGSGEGAGSWAGQAQLEHKRI